VGHKMRAIRPEQPGSTAQDQAKTRINHAQAEKPLQKADDKDLSTDA